MAISFPGSPSQGDVYTYNGIKYVFDGTKWVSGGATAFLLNNGDSYTGVYSTSGTEAFGIPAGTTAERPVTPVDGQIRLNTETGSYEGYSGTTWGGLGGGATGGGEDRVFFTNEVTVTADYTLPTGENAMSTGPITIADGVTVTIPDNQNWVVL